MLIGNFPKAWVLQPPYVEHFICSTTCFISSSALGAVLREGGEGTSNAYLVIDAKAIHRKKKDGGCTFHRNTLQTKLSPLGI